MHRIREVQIGLTADEVQEVFSIVLDRDRDRDRDMEFMQSVLGKKVEKQLQEQ